MSQELYEERLGRVEHEIGSVKADMRVMGHDVTALKQTVGDVAGGVRQLLEREAKRPEPATFKNVATTLGGTAALVGALAAFVWWFIAASPVVQDLDRRLTRLDDPDVGRVPRLEKDRGWQARVNP